MSQFSQQCMQDTRPNRQNLHPNWPSSRIAIPPLIVRAAGHPVADLVPTADAARLTVAAAAVAIATPAAASGQEGVVGHHIAPRQMVPVWWDLHVHDG